MYSPSASVVAASVASSVQIRTPATPAPVLASRTVPHSMLVSVEGTSPIATSVPCPAACSAFSQAADRATDDLRTSSIIPGKYPYVSPPMRLENVTGFRPDAEPVRTCAPSTYNAGTRSEYTTAKWCHVVPSATAWATTAGR